ncbi:MAG: hypothetical protein HYY01_05060 [Chloroflexi bacterium]|nr:hypothetical protein [Chloroflexota bacterium]
MNWVIWVLLLIPLGVPVGSLTLDRIFGIPARQQWVILGIPGLGVLVGALIYALAVGDPVAQLVGWGALAGVLGTALLDAVRLTGVRLGAFPADMPQIFGTIALGLAPRFQRNMMAEMVAATSTMPQEERQVALEKRLTAVARMPAPRRQAVMAGMMAGLGRLPEDRRQAMLQTQMGILTRLPEGDRRTLMMTMDAVMAEMGNGTGHLPYGQPRGMPQIPMATFRAFSSRALPRTWEEARVSKGVVLALGYLWHFVIGSTFGITYMLVFGQGSWGMAIGWGVFVWLAMMIAMPPMMPIIRFPRWFPVVPLIAHIAMAVPFAVIALYLVSGDAHLHSLLGALS